MHRYSWYLAVAVWSIWALGVWCFVDPAVFRWGWPIAPTMLVGSFIAGSTSAGGGAVAFPVMTLVFGVDPPVARDFSLLIQSVGMGSASIGIVLMRIRVEWKAILWANFGGLIGIAVGFRIAAGWPPSLTKMFFVSLWAAFALALYLINRRGREVVLQIDTYDKSKITWLVGIGVVGGVVSGLTGSGLDIITFAVLTLVFRLCESAGTPTSVIIMAINAFAGSLIRLCSGDVFVQAIDYWWCAVPVVVVGAPVGAWYIKNKSRTFITRILYASVVIQFIGALLIVPQDAATVTIVLGVITIGSAGFLLMSRIGRA